MKLFFFCFVFVIIQFVHYNKNQKQNELEQLEYEVTNSLIFRLGATLKWPLGGDGSGGWLVIYSLEVTMKHHEIKILLNSSIPRLINSNTIINIYVSTYCKIKTTIFPYI